MWLIRWMRRTHCGLVHKHSPRSDIKFQRQDYELTTRMIGYWRCLRCDSGHYAAVVISDKDLRDRVDAMQAFEMARHQILNILGGAK